MKSSKYRVWIFVGAISAIAFLATTFELRLPLTTRCAAEACKEGREWFSVFLTLSVITAGLIQYRAAQRQHSNAQLWKRTEWIASEAANFFNDERAMHALRMLDWNHRRFPFLPEDEPPGRKYFVFRSSLLQSALLTRNRTDPSGKVLSYTPAERAVRDYFDRMLDRLERFEIFIENELVGYEELKPYLEYWIQLVGDKTFGRKDSTTILQLWRFIEAYKFTRVQKLCLRFGYDIRSAVMQDT